MMERVPVAEKNRPTKEIKLYNVSQLIANIPGPELIILQITIHANPVAAGQK